MISKSNYFLDLRGVECPLNFARTKIQLEKMLTGEVLEVLLDPGEAVESVVKSMKEEGQKIILLKKVDNYFKVLIEKS